MILLHTHIHSLTYAIYCSRLKAESTSLCVFIYTPSPEGPWNMHSSPMHNTWAQQEKRTCEPSGSPPLHLLTPPLPSSSLLSTRNAFCCCACVLNNNCLSGSFVGQKSWWREHVKARQKDRLMATGNRIRWDRTVTQKDTFLCLAGRDIIQRERRQMIQCFHSAETKAAGSFNRITNFTGWLSKGQTICRHHRMLRQHTCRLVFYLQKVRCSS